MAGLCADYTIGQGALESVNTGGVCYMGSTNGDAANTAAMKVPSYTSFDAAISCDFGNFDPKMKGLQLALNATNLFDKKFVASCASAYQCFYGTGRVFMATVSYRW